MVTMQRCLGDEKKNQKKNFTLNFCYNEIAAESYHKTKNDIGYAVHCKFI